MTKEKIVDLVDRFGEIKNKIDELEKEKDEIRTKLINEIDKKFPDKKRSAKIEVGNFNVIRVEIPKIKWDLKKLENLIGEQLFKQITKIKTTVDEDKVENFIKDKKIDKKAIFKVTKVNYQEQLRVNLKSEKDNEEFGEKRSFIEEMNY